jgi:hypothetical protein
VLAINLTSYLRPPDDDLPAPPLEKLPAPAAVVAALDRPWRIGKSVVKQYGDLVVAEADKIVVGVYRVAAAHRDDTDPRLVTFEVKPAPHWEWLIGQPSPSTRRWGKDPVQKLPKIHAPRPPAAAEGHGWSLQVDPDGLSAVIHAPGGAVVVTALDRNTVHLAAGSSPEPLR